MFRVEFLRLVQREEEEILRAGRHHDRVKPSIISQMIQRLHPALQFCCQQNGTLKHQPYPSCDEEMISSHRCRPPGMKLSAHTLGVVLDESGSIVLHDNYVTQGCDMQISW